MIEGFTDWFPVSPFDLGKELAKDAQQKGSSHPNDVLSNLSQQADAKARAEGQRDAIAAKNQAMAQVSAEIAKIKKKATAIGGALLVAGAGVGTFFAVRHYRKRHA